MANIKLINDNWEASGVYDLPMAKTQRQINADVYSGYPKLNGKRIIIYGDSISDETATVTGFNMQPNWVTYLKNHCGATVDNRSVAGRSITGSNGVAQAIRDSTDLNADIILIFAGVNDYRVGRQLGDYSSTADYTTLWGALRWIYNKLYAAAPGANIFLMSPLKEYATESYPSSHDQYKPISMYRKVMKTFATWFGWHYIDGYSAPILNPFYRTDFQPDKLHPNSDYAPYLCNYIASKLEINENMELGDETTTIALNNLADSGLTQISSFNAYFQQDTGEITLQGGVTYTNTPNLRRYNIATGLPVQFRPRYYVASPAYGTLTGENIPGTVLLNADGDLFLSLYGNPTTSNSGTIIFEVTFIPKFAIALTNVSI